MTEACSGLTAPLTSITWYQAPTVSGPAVPDWAGGYWSLASNRIVLENDLVLDGVLVRHEMLHALLRSGGHPRTFFIGKCAGTVDCQSACVADAGPFPPADPSSVLVTPNDLEIHVAVEPQAPSSAVDDGSFMLTVTAQNASSKPVIVALPQSPFHGVSPMTFAYDIRGPGGRELNGVRMYDSAAVTFQPWEIKRQVFDFRIGEYFGSGVVVPGDYVFGGSYGGKGASTSATIRP